MAFRYFLLAFVWCCCSAESLKKCCPKEQGLITTKHRGSTSYRCAEAFNNYTTLPNKTMHPLVVGMSGFKFSYGFPENCAYSPYDFFKNSQIHSNNCVDKVFADTTPNGTIVIGDGSVVFLACDSENIQRPNMTSIAKCCLKNMVFDPKNHNCVNKSLLGTRDANYQFSAEGLFEKFVENESVLVNVKYGSPYCPFQKAVYEYSDSLYNLVLTDDRVILNRYNSSENFVLEPGTFCVDETLQDKVIVRACRDVYEGVPRVYKCCQEGYIFEIDSTRKPTCTPSSESGIFIEFYDVSTKNISKSVSQPDVFGISYTIGCDDKHQLEQDNDKEKHYIDVTNGELFAPKYNFKRPKYCIDRFKTPEGISSITLTCFLNEKNHVKIRKKLEIYSIGLVISSIFLAITLLVYIALPPLRNLHGKIIMCHVAIMLVAYSCLARVQSSMEGPKNTCRVFGYVIYFSFIAAFSWLNVMCFDIWWTFANVRTMQMMRPDKDLIRFLKYSSYAWGVPAVLTLITFLIDTYNVAPGWLDPNIGEPQCWINTSVNSSPLLILFTLPVGLQIFTNLVFFILTAIYCNKVKSEIHRVQAGSRGEQYRNRFTADKAKFAMNLKLFIVMGISWIMEILSSLLQEPMELWYFADAINILQGIPIFCILVLKRKIFHLIMKRLGSKKSSKRPSLEDPKLLSCIERVQLRPRSDITMTTGISSMTSEGRKSSAATKSDTGLNGLLLSKSNNDGKSP